jgi:hypothetical protein
MSATAGPKRQGVSRQAKGQEYDPTKVEAFTLFTWRGMVLRIPGVPWGGKTKRNDIHKWIASDGAELVSTTDVQTTLAYLYM